MQYSGKFEVLNELYRFKSLGQHTTEGGAVLIGRAPHIAPLAWLHSLYPPLSLADIADLEGKLKMPVPHEYKQFLQLSNGLNVFNTTLSLFGLRRNYIRDVENVWQPFDIITPNTIEKPGNASNNVFIFGTYDWDGSYLYIDCEKGNTVHLCTNDDITSLYKWPNLEAVLKSEIKRLLTMFDGQGKELDPDESTLPIDY
jgi:hypothetical protein